MESAIQNTEVKEDIKNLIETHPRCQEFVEKDSQGFIKFTEKLIELIVDEESAKLAYSYISQNSGCGFIIYHPPLLPQSRETIKHAFRVFVKCADYLKRIDLYNHFPKTCPGCMFLNILLCAGLNEALIPEVEAFLRKLFNDQSCLIIEPGEIRISVRETKKLFQRHGSNPEPYPYMGNCLDFR